MLILHKLSSEELTTIFLLTKDYRNIGPFRGGRANAGTGVEGEPLHYYMGDTKIRIYNKIGLARWWCLENYRWRSTLAEYF